MIEAVWQVAVVFLTIALALLGGYWKCLGIANSNKTRYQQDAIALRSILLSSELIPQIVSLIERVERSRSRSKAKAIDEIVSTSSTAFQMKSMEHIMSKLNDVDTLYFRTVSTAFTCAYDLLTAVALPALVVVWLFVDAFWDYFAVLIVFGGVILAIRVIYDFLKYTEAVRQFIKKDDEIRLGRSGR